MILLVQKFLKIHSLKNLQIMHGVYASVSKNKRKISLNYDQIETKESDVLSWDCRGLILTKADLNEFDVLSDGKLDTEIIVGDTQVAAFGLRRFFNYGQGAAININWSDSNLSILEKLDGTLCIVYFDSFTDKWCVATRSVPEADLLMDNGLFTFRTLFEKALKETTGYEFDIFTRYLDKAYTYCFELTTPYNRIVVEYKNCGVTLLAVRGLVTLQEIAMSHPVVDLLPTSLPLVKSYTYNSIDELVNWVSTLNPMEHEGVVVRDSNFNRIKIKNAAYVAYNKLNDRLGTSERNCIEIILLEKDDDVIPFLPEEIVNNLLKIKAGLQVAIKAHDDAYLEAKAQADAIFLGDKKTFAILVTKNKNLWHAPFFQMFDGKAKNMKDFISKNCKDGSWGNSFLDKLLELSKIT